MSDVTAEILIDGKPWQPETKPCAHVNFGVETTVHEFREGGQPGGARVGARIVVKALCLECGETMLFDPSKVDVSDDRSKIGVHFTPTGGWPER